MEKLKNMVSHRKSEDSTTGPNRGAGESNVLGVHREGEHPIYDQMTNSTTRSSGEPTRTTDNASNFSNTPDGKQTPGPSATQNATPSLHPDTAQRRPGSGNEQLSVASIKSGVIGFSQGSQDTHATLENDDPAEQNLGGNQVVGGGNLSDPTYRQENDKSHLGGMTAKTGAGALADTELNRNVEGHSHNTSYAGEQQPFEKSLGQPAASSGTERSFPLAGGVIGHRPSKKTATSALEPGTREKEAGSHDGEGRERLAGAAAAATASSALPGHRHEMAKDTQPTGSRTGQTGETKQGHHPDALAAARVAASHTRSVPPLGQEQNGSSSGPTSASGNNNPSTSSQPGTSLLFTKGPHPTDTGNMFDPHLHIPGEFPSPTPIEEPPEPSYITSRGSASVLPGGQHELRHTGTLDEPKTKSADQTAESTSEHHYGRDAAITGGLAAAGGGAYAAGRHHKEPTQTGKEEFSTEQSPYSSRKIDPRVDTKPHGSSQQRYDAATTDKPTGRDSTLTGGAGQSSHPTSDEKSQEHHGRDAALLGGAGAATTAGLYAFQRTNEPSSGPASSTIGPHKSNAANILDPRVQPDPALQKHHHAAPTVDDPAPSTVGPHKSDIANVVDPRVLPDPQKQKAAPKEEKADHKGRDAAIAGGVGTGAYDAAKAYDSHRGTQPGASMNEQRYDPSAEGAHTSTSTVTQGTRDLKQSEHHYGRDAAVVGGLGAAGAGAYAASRGNERGQQGHAAQQQYPTAGPQQLYAGQQPSVSQHQYPPTQTSHQTHLSQDPQQAQHHYGRDAAMVGGLGAAGAGVYATARGNEHSQVQQPPLSQQQYPPTSSQQISGSQHEHLQTQRLQQISSSQEPQQSQHHYGRDAAIVGGLGATGAGTYTATRNNNQYQQSPAGQQTSFVQSYNQQPLSPAQHSFAGATHQRTDSAQDPNSPTQKQHQKRDTAVLGVAGAAAGAGGAYAYSHEHETAQKAHEQQLIGQQKAFDEQQKDIEKAHAKEQKQHDKLAAAEEKKHSKDLERGREKQHEYEEEPKEKKHHFFGFLHRDKDRKNNSSESSPRASGENTRHSREFGAAGVGAGIGGAAAYGAAHDSDKEREGRHKLHKDPPKGHPAREALEKQHPQHEQGMGLGKREHIGTDGPIGIPDQISGDRMTQAGVYGAHDPDSQHHTVIEPHTGLPMNVEKYGDGHGGTDGNQTIEGYHLLPGQEQQAGGGKVTDWEAIRKANTPY